MGRVAAHRRAARDPRDRPARRARGARRPARRPRRSRVARRARRQSVRSASRDGRSTSRSGSSRPRQRLVRSPHRSGPPSAPRSSGCSAWSSAGSPSWSMASGRSGDGARARRGSNEEHVRAPRAAPARARVGVRGRVRPADGGRDPRAAPRRRRATPEAAGLARELVANVVATPRHDRRTIDRGGTPISGRPAGPDGPRAAPLRHSRSATLARDAGPGGNRRMGRARTDLQWRADAAAHERRARAGLAGDQSATR